MENRKWLFFHSNTGWKNFAYNEEKEELYVQAYLSPTTYIVQNVDVNLYNKFISVAKTGKREAIDKWFADMKEHNGISIEMATRELITNGKYNIPEEYVNEMDKPEKKAYYKSLHRDKPLLKRLKIARELAK